MSRAHDIVSWWALGWLLCGALAGLGCSEVEPEPTERSEPQASTVAPATRWSLSVTGARAERTESVIHESGGARTVRGLDVALDVSLDNAGEPVAVRTNFQSVFDGFELVLSLADETELARVGYTRHQSPFAEGRALPLPSGTTTATLGFPLTEWKATASELRVRLEGGLVGTEWSSGLVSNEVALVLPH